MYGKRITQNDVLLVTCSLTFSFLFSHFNILLRACINTRGERNQWFLLYYFKLLMWYKHCIALHWGKHSFMLCERIILRAASLQLYCKHVRRWPDLRGDKPEPEERITALGEWWGMSSTVEVNMYKMFGLQFRHRSSGKNVKECEGKMERWGSWKRWKSDSPTPLSSTVGLSIQRCACSIFPSKCTAAFAGLLFATALLVLDCKFCRAVAICLAKALASGVSPLPL